MIQLGTGNSIDSVYRRSSLHCASKMPRACGATRYTPFDDMEDGSPAPISLSVICTQRHTAHGGDRHTISSSVVSRAARSIYMAHQLTQHAHPLAPPPHHCAAHTGVSRRCPAQSAAWLTLVKIGCCSTGPMTGMFRSRLRMIGKKLPNRFSMPNTSTTMPTTGHFTRTRMMPPRKQKVPRSLAGRLKKMRVFLKPISSVMPSRKRS